MLGIIWISKFFFFNFHLIEKKIEKLKWIKEWKFIEKLRGKLN